MPDLATPFPYAIQVLPYHRFSILRFPNDPLALSLAAQLLRTQGPSVQFFSISCTAQKASVLQESSTPVWWLNLPPRVATRAQEQRGCIFLSVIPLDSETIDFGSVQERTELMM